MDKRLLNYHDWTLDKWLDILENRHQTEIQLRLVNPKEVAQRLDLLTIDLPVITVTGTNGKGSTVAALTAIYRAAGYRVGSFTSPHVMRFNERICVNQQPITDEALCRAFSMIEDARGTLPLTYFEVTTLAALLYFKESVLDVMILEVGIGGRLDVTNIIDADLSIITTVDLDHQEYLGPDKESIGYEKAGIMRANKTCIYADESPPKRVRSHAAGLNVKLLVLGEDYNVTVNENRLNIHRSGAEPVAVSLPNLNHHAAVAAIIATDCLTARLPVSRKHWEVAMQSVHVLGRQQWIKGRIPVLFDVAHNPQAVALLADVVGQYACSGKVHAVFSGLKDKDLGSMIETMAPFVDVWHPALLSGKRAADKTLLSTIFHSKLGFKPVCYDNPEEAFQAANQAATVGDIIVVYGSFLLVGPVMEGLYETGND